MSMTPPASRTPTARHRAETTELFTEAVANQLDEDFLACQLGRQLVVTDVGAAAVAGLATWQDINAILASRPVLEPQRRLYRSGTQVPVEAYARVVGQGGRRREVLRPERLYAELRAGASLIIDSMETLHPPVTAAAEDLTRFVRAPVQANLYVTWGTSRGFDAHWDDHDTFIVQIRGTKSWTVYGPARAFPIRDDVAPNDTCPEQVCWQGVLHAGQVLHVPRGWWHQVQGAGDISVHVTFGFGQRTGVDWLRWLVDQAAHHELFRQDLPRFAQPATRHAHQQTLAERLAELAADHPLEDYLTHFDTRTPRRRRLCLPGAVDPDSLDLAEETMLRFTPVMPRLVSENGIVQLATDRKRFTFAPAMEPMLRTLADHEHISCGDLRRASGLDTATFRSAVTLLVEQHLAVVEPPSSTAAVSRVHQ